MRNKFFQKCIVILQISNLLWMGQARAFEGRTTCMEFDDYGNAEPCDFSDTHEMGFGEGEVFGTEGSFFDGFSGSDFGMEGAMNRDFADQLKNYDFNSVTFDSAGNVRSGTHTYSVTFEDDQVNVSRADGYRDGLMVRGYIAADLFDPFVKHLTDKKNAISEARKKLETQIDALKKIRALKQKLDDATVDSIENVQLEDISPFYKDAGPISQELADLKKPIEELKSEIASRIKTAQDYYQHVKHETDQKFQQAQELSAQIDLEWSDLSQHLDQNRGTQPQGENTPSESPEGRGEAQSLAFELRSPPGQFREKLSQLANDLNQLNPNTEEAIHSKELGLISVQESDLAYSEGDIAGATTWADLGREFLDLALGFNPVTGFAQSVYELAIGKSIITGVDLTRFDRTLAFVGVITAGGFKGLGTVAKAETFVGKVLNRARHLVRDSRGAEVAVREGVRIGDSAGHIERFHPLKHGPLHAIQEGVGTVADTFRSSSYFEVVTKEPIKLYRVYGGEVGPLGRYWSRIKPTGPLQATLDSALDPSFGNSAKHWVEITVPAGTKFYEGMASDMFLKLKGSDIQIGNLLGGGSQVYITEKVLESWNIIKGAF